MFTTSLRCVAWYAALWGGAAACSGRVAPSSRGEAPNPPQITVLESADPVPTGGDGAPRFKLAFRNPDGTRTPIAGEALAFVPFRDGVARLEPDRALTLVSRRGTRRVLARESGVPPALAADGALLFVSRHGDRVALHRLSTDGRDTTLAKGLGGVSVLAPAQRERDGRVAFVGAPRGGGIAGLWIASEREPARCLVNCDLQPGQAFIAVPGSAESIRLERDRISWRGHDGVDHVVALPVSSDRLSPGPQEPSP